MWRLTATYIVQWPCCEGSVTTDTPSLLNTYSGRSAFTLSMQLATYSDNCGRRVRRRERGARRQECSEIKDKQHRVAPRDTYPRHLTWPQLLMLASVLLNCSNSADLSYTLLPIPLTAVGLAKRPPCLFASG